MKETYRGDMNDEAGRPTRLRYEVEVRGTQRPEGLEYLTEHLIEALELDK